MAELPRGTVTLLFTDIEGSTRLLQKLGRDRYVRALETHRRLLRDAFTAHGGVEVEMQGDSFHFAFAFARDAVAAAAAGQRVLADHPWEDEPIRVRVGVHTGEPLVSDGLYAGLDVHRAARVMSAGHGGQVLVSQASAALVGAELPADLSLRDLGEHRLRDLGEPQRLYQLVGTDLQSEFPPPSTLEARRTNLPVQSNRLVAREREIANVVRRVRDEGARLLTLTGPGGTGKTRLALHVAAELVDDFRDGVFFVPLAPVRDAELVLPTVAQTLGVREQGEQPLPDLLADYLASRRMLLVLDNLEQVVAAAPALARLQSRAPDLSLLVTSREPLDVAGEQLYPVPPLATPPAETRFNLGEALTSGAVELFFERARAARPDLVPTTDDVETVAAICRRVDGLPLAVELAAARMRVLSPKALHSRLSASLTLLKGGARDADERHRTLRATIDWSHDLLSDREQRVFAALGLFAGGCRPEAAEAVCESEAGDEVFDALCSLVDKSLLRRSDDADGEPRFWALETIREYALERLELAGSAEAVRVRHADHFLAVAEEAAPALKRAEQFARLERLDADHANLRGAFLFATTRGDADRSLRFVAALYHFWDLRGHLEEGIAAARAALEIEGGRRELRARALLGLGCVEYSRSNHRDSIAHLEQALDLFRAAGEGAGLAAALVELGWSRHASGDNDGARALAEEGLNAAATVGNRWYAALAQQLLGAVAPPGHADARSAEAAGMFAELGDEIFAARATGGRGWHALESEDYDAARAWFTESLSSARRFGDVTQVAVNRSNLGLTELLAGNLVEAEEHLRAVVKLARDVGAWRVAGEALWALAGVAAASGDDRRAARLHETASWIYETVGSPPSPIDVRIEERLLRGVATAGARPPVGPDGGLTSFDDAVAYALCDGAGSASLGARAADAPRA